VGAVGSSDDDEEIEFAGEGGGDSEEESEGGSGSSADVTSSGASVVDFDGDSGVCRLPVTVGVGCLQLPLAGAFDDAVAVTLRRLGGATVSAFKREAVASCSEQLAAASPFWDVSSVSGSAYSGAVERAVIAV
jgi:hypothetical protein